ncbi:helix-turn-helix transcriptional regulator [Altererythrobacter epoxidivorans]|nr:helix-turn-helix transcriptional regulator [Altererythrobacter epoxidivorans]
MAAAPVPVGMTRHWGNSFGHPDWMFEGTKLSAEDLDRTFIPVIDDLRLIANLVENVGEKALLTSVIERPVVAPGGLLSRAPDLGASLKVLTAELTRTSPYFLVEFTHGDEMVGIDIATDPDVGPLGRFLELTCLFLLLRLIDSFIGHAGPGQKTRPVIAAEISGVEEGLIAEINAIAQERFVMSDQSTMLRLHTSYLDLPNPDYRNSQREELQEDPRVGQPTASASVQSLKAQIRERLRLNRRIPQMADLASERGMSVRTLARELSSKGLSLRNLTNDVRMELSAEYLASGEMSVSQVSENLGYSEASSFIRSFRKNFGTAPGEWRRGTTRARL